MKLAEVEESRLEAAREPRLDVSDPGLLPEDRDCMLLERLGTGRGREREREDNEVRWLPGTPPGLENTKGTGYVSVFLAYLTA